MAKKYYTVVYAVDGDDDFQAKWWNETVHPFFQHSEEPKAVKITAASLCDEMTKLNCIEHVAEDDQEFDDLYYKVETIKELIANEDPLAWWKEHVDKETG